jgi:hypothetical protein
MADKEQSHMTSSGEQVKQTRAERAVGKQMTALDLLARWSGHHYFIGYCYTLLPPEIKWRVDSCVEFAFPLATIHVPVCSSLHFCLVCHDYAITF